MQEIKREKSINSPQFHAIESQEQKCKLAIQRSPFLHMWKETQASKRFHHEKKVFAVAMTVFVSQRESFDLASFRGLPKNNQNPARTLLRAIRPAKSRNKERCERKEIPRNKFPGHKWASRYIHLMPFLKLPFWTHAERNVGKHKFHRHEVETSVVTH